jgi:hypothetical protein
MNLEQPANTNVLQPPAPLRIGDTRESGALRIHRYRESLRLTDLTNAGKRGKSVRTICLHPSLRPSSPADALLELLDRVSESVLKHTTLDAALEALSHDLPDATQWLSARLERGVDVTPAGFLVLTVRTSHIDVEADYASFRIRDLTDPLNEPTTIHSGRKGSMAFYRWVSAVADDLHEVRYSEVLRHLRRLDIPHHSYCAID